ncbi:hypothetical protein MHO82_23265 [Vibrio sp. Of7-15]|uniref:hypothetical protein n=1 Tax=Vibrio sp. Of7-15 TaxID=2724879 RepID=UPI001EF1B61A|nr:hypothetical protein [Vibrio sp. Of7-15]MCG7499791.1 hypothetical protein [Vibrio sp. Of7-15]
MNMFKYVCPKCKKLEILSESDIETIVDHQVITCQCGEDLQLRSDSEQLELLKAEKKENVFWGIKQFIVCSLAFILCIMFIVSYTFAPVALIVIYAARQILKRTYYKESVDLELEAVSDASSLVKA